MIEMFCPKHRIAACIALFLLLLAGCATNPVTGKRELRLVSEAQEMRMGRQHYLASQQMQGGAYNVDPELTRYVREVGAKLARVSDRGLAYEFVVLNNSTPNAWALPGGKIAVNRGLLVELDNEAELAAVLGHEIVHAAARHGAKNVERGMLLQGAVAVADMAAQDSDYAALIVGGAGLAAGLLAQTYSRKAEREADFYGIQYMARAGYDPQAAVSLQEVFVQLSAVALGPLRQPPAFCRTRRKQSPDGCCATSTRGTPPRALSAEDSPLEAHPGSIRGVRRGTTGSQQRANPGGPRVGPGSAADGAPRSAVPCPTRRRAVYAETLPRSAAAL